MLTSDLPPNPSEQSTASGLLALARTLEVADILILDSPPLLTVTDAAVLSKVDGTLIVVEAGRPEKPCWRNAAIRAVDGKLLGVVMNPSPQRAQDITQTIIIRKSMAKKRVKSWAMNLLTYNVTQDSSFATRRRMIHGTREKHSVLFVCRHNVPVAYRSPAAMRFLQRGKSYKTGGWNPLAFGPMTAKTERNDTTLEGKPDIARRIQL